MSVYLTTVYHSEFRHLEFRISRSLCGHHELCVENPIVGISKTNSSTPYPTFNRTGDSRVYYDYGYHIFGVKLLVTKSRFLKTEGYAVYWRRETQSKKEERGKGRVREREKRENLIFIHINPDSLNEKETR